MGKKLVGHNNVEQYICHDEKKIYVDPTMILSPGAKDYLNKNRITAVYGPKPEPPSAKKVGAEPEQARELATRVVKILRNDYGILDDQKVCEITSQVFKKLHASA